MCVRNLAVNADNTGFDFNFCINRRMDSWYYNDAGQQRGPVDAEEIRSLLETRGINDETLVWSEGMPEWKPVSDVTGFEISLKGDSSSPTI